ncbi:MAG TPA: hypothetical protein VGM82_19385 [Gemmatimonadaceae bacterium]
MSRSAMQLSVIDDDDYDSARRAIVSLAVSPKASSAPAADRRFRKFSIVVAILALLLAIGLVLAARS